jgi:hypothetical protein
MRNKIAADCNKLRIPGFAPLCMQARLEQLIRSIDATRIASPLQSGERSGLVRRGWLAKDRFPFARRSFGQPRHLARIMEWIEMNIAEQESRSRVPRISEVRLADGRASGKDAANRQDTTNKNAPSSHYSLHFAPQPLRLVSPYQFTKIEGFSFTKDPIPECQ